MKDTELDRMLDGMADGTPPMPGDFHQKWMDAVRAEAEKTPSPVRGAGSRWIRVISTAAVFIFLIGGTFIHRSLKTGELPRAAAPKAAPAADTAAPAGRAPERKAAYSAANSPGGGPETAEEISLEAGAAAMTEASGERENEGPAPDAALPAAGAFGAEPLAEEAFDAAFPEMDESLYTGAETEEDAETYDAAFPEPGAKPAETAEARLTAAETGTAQPTATVLPAATALPTAEPAAEEPEPEESAREAEATELPGDGPASERSGIGGFLADMGDFLLTVWPYVLAAAAAAALVTGIRKGRRASRR